jgi:very-short-patch-repair endonuclease
MPRLLRPATAHARALRRAETPAERELWRWLRGRRLDGAKFRRQHPIGPFFADFYCVEARLVVEADGEPHVPPTRRDERRDAWLRSTGLVVLRFENREILEHTARTLERIRDALRNAPR